MKISKEISLSDLEEHQNAVNMDNELRRMQQFLRQNGADQEMMEVIGQCILDNQMWIHKDLLVSGSA